MTFFRWRRLHAMVAALSLAGCAGPALQLPDELAPAERLEVQGMRALRTPDALTFGTYRATAIDRSWTRGSGLSVAGMSRNRARQSYLFQFADGPVEQGAVSCETSAQRRSMDLEVIQIDGGADVLLDCTLAPGGGALGASGAAAGADASVWRLSLASTRDRHLEGELSSGGLSYQVRGVGRGGKYAPAETHGFHLLREGRVVGAVQTVAPGVVWFLPELDTESRRLLAIGAVALLLYEEPPTDS